MPLGIFQFPWFSHVNAKEGHDLTEELGVQKWEVPLSPQLAGVAKGNFPSFIRKTDQERIQNCYKEMQRDHADKLFEGSIKLDGSSMTVYLKDDVFGVCSRNLDLQETEDNTFWKVARKNKFEEMLRTYGKNVAIQGELMGPGIQGNIYNLTSPEFHVFDIYDIRKGEYLSPRLRRDVVAMLQLNHVPVIMSDVMLPSGNVQDILAMAEGKSVLNHKQEREGIVFKSVIGGITFKAISNSYLLKNVG